MIELTREARYRKNRYGRRKAAGLCVSCGAVPPEPGTIRCLNCKHKNRKSVQKQRSRDKKLGICREAGCSNPANGTHCEKHRLEARKLADASIRRLKIECFTAYGGVQCRCCGEPELSTLCLDHIDNSGGEHRRQLESKINPHGHRFYRYLKSLGYPDKDRYQVLCANCNLYKLIKGGPCYHVARKSIL